MTAEIHSDPKTIPNSNSLYARNEMRINDPSVCSSSGTLLQAGAEPVAKIYLTRDGEVSVFKEMGRTRARGTEQA